MLHLSNKIPIYLFSIICLFIYETINAQSNTRQNYPKQKIFIHFDKDFYAIGEKMWIKAYLLENQETPDSLKKCVFVDIVNSAGNVVQHLILKVYNNGAEGNILIPNNWPEGVYFIKAYTPYLMAYGQEAFFSKDIAIYSSNPENAWAFTPNNSNQKTKVNLFFFPEGGQLVEGFESKIAFSAQNENGEGISVQGYIKDNRDSIVANFQSSNYEQINKPQGIGYFYLKPIFNQSYQAIIKLTNGEVFNFPLPNIKSNGFTLKLEDIDKTYFNLKINATGLEKTEGISLNISQDGQELLNLNGQLSASEPSILFKLNKLQLPEGLLLIQLIDDNKSIIAERICFNPLKKRENLSLRNTQENFGIRGNIKLIATGESLDNEMIKKNYSLTVRKKISTLSFENISSYYWLSSALDKPIEHSAYYLLENEPNAKNDLDGMLLTQKIKLHTNQPDFTKIEYDINALKCIARDSITHTPVSSSSIGVFSYETQKAYNSFTDRKGNFLIKIKDSLDKQTLFFFNTEKTNYLNDPIEVEVVRYNPTHYTVKPKLLPHNNDIKQYLIDFNKRRFIENNFYSQDTTQNKSLYTKLINLTSSQTIKLDEYVDFADMRELFKEIAYNVTTRTKNEQTKIRLVTDKKPNFKMAFPPFYIINGQPTTNHNLILNMSVSDVQKIEVFADYPSLIKSYNKFGAGGFITFETKKDIYNLKDRINVKTVQFYNKIDNFQSQNFTQSEASLPFFSPLIVWQPNLSSLNNGISFYHTDDIGDFEVILEGINAEGKPVQAYFEYKVGIGK